jgi:hypothetical protein
LYRYTSGLPFELYTDAERAPVGAAFPMARDVAGGVIVMAPDFAEINQVGAVHVRESSRPIA